MNFTSIACSEFISKKNGKKYYKVAVVIDGNIYELFSMKFYAVGDSVPCTIQRQVVGSLVLPVIAVNNFAE